MAYTHQNIYGRNQEFPITEGAVFQFLAIGSSLKDGIEITMSNPNNHEIRFTSWDSDGAIAAVACNVKLESRPTNTQTFKDITTILDHDINDVWTEVVGEMYEFRLTITTVTVGAGNFVIMTDGIS